MHTPVKNVCAQVELVVVETSVDARSKRTGYSPGPAQRTPTRELRNSQKSMSIGVKCEGLELLVIGKAHHTTALSRF